MDSSPIFGPEGRFAVIVAALCRAVAASLNRGLMEAAVIVLVWRRVKRVERLLLALAERVRLGLYRRGFTQPSRAARGEGVRVGERASSGAWHLLPRRFGWLMGLMPYKAAAYSSQLSCVLAEPEMVALLRDVPQAQRIIRPLCVMLGLDFEGLREKRPRPVRVAAVPEVVPVPVSVPMVRPGYVPSAKWPKGVAPHRRVLRSG